MIGVISRESQKAAVEEFFELFKTPWEHCRDDMEYDVVITTDPASPVPPAKLVIIFGAVETFLDNREGGTIHFVEVGGEFEWEGEMIPVYGRLATFPELREPFLSGKGGKAAGFTIVLLDRKIPPGRVRPFRRDRTSPASRATCGESAHPHLGHPHRHAAEMDRRQRCPADGNPSIPAWARLYHLPHPRHRFHGNTRP